MASSTKKTNQQNLSSNLNTALENNKWYNLFKNTYFLIPLALILAIVPLIVFLKIVPVDKSIIEFWTGDQNYDFFSYVKMQWLLVFTICSVILFAITAKNEDMKPINTIYYYPVIVYAFFIFVSTIFSNHKSTSLFGFCDRYEGLLTLFAYLTIFVLAINFSAKEIQVKFLMFSLFASALLLGILGMGQYFGLDIFKSYNGRLMILPSDLQSLASSLQFQFKESDIYATLYHTNYVGSYTAMLFPISIALYFLASKKMLRIPAVLFSCLMFATWLGSRSRASYIGVGAASIIALFVFRKVLINRWKRVLVLLLSFALTFYIMDTTKFNVLNDEALNALPEAERTALAQDTKFKFTIDEYTYYFRFSTTTKPLSSEFLQIKTDVNRIEGETKSTMNFSHLKDIVFTPFSISLVGIDNTLNITIENNELLFKDSKGIIIKTIADQNINRYVFDDNRFSTFSYIYDQNQSILNLQLESITMNIAVTAAGFKFINNRGEAVDPPKVERFGFKGKEQLASARGYIWSRSLPLFKKTIFKGFGPDTFTIYFPQKDYLGKLLAYNDSGIIVDKPHNLYIQVGLNTGLFSLLALLAMFGIYFITSLILYFKGEFSSEFSIYGVSIFIAFLAFAVTSIFNDSLVSVAPVFWIIFGVGVRCNIEQFKKLNSKTENITN